jgi:hypothetical protein
MVLGEVVRAPKGADLVVQKIELVDAQNIDASKAFIVPMDSGLDPIDNAPYPPSANGTWAARIPAANATIRAGEQANLLIVVTRSGAQDGSATGMRLDFLGGSKTNATSYQFRTSCSTA